MSTIFILVFFVFFSPCGLWSFDCGVTSTVTTPFVVKMSDTEEIPRTILALFDSTVESSKHLTLIHIFAETPLNHLGYRVEYHDIQEALPELEKRKDVAGVLTWFPDGFEISDPRTFFQWAIRAIDLGKKWVVLDNPGLPTEPGAEPQPESFDFWSRMGLRDLNSWTTRTYLIRFSTLDPEVVPFERPYVGILPTYRRFQISSPECTVHVAAREGDDPATESCLVMTSPVGGYVAQGYAFYIGYFEETEYKQWMVNPFTFFQKAFDRQNIPKADTTTVAGRRIYYSHIDGDGWNSITQLEDYRANPTLCSEVIRQKIIEPYDDLPFTVGPIGADIDLSWVGTKNSRIVAERLFALPNVEVGSHTFTHPFDWGFFKDYKPAEEIPFLHLYPNGGWIKPNLLNLLVDSWKTFRQRATGESVVYAADEKEDNYDIPRAYALQPFDLTLETDGAIAETNGLSDRLGKRVQVYQWSGNCFPFEAALRMVREAGVKNLNGGATRLDDEYPSYAYVSPLGRRVESEQQIYASNSNENTYTQLWTAQFYGFNKLPQTFKNTESPIRLKPMNLYFHMYSGERLPSLYALLSNIHYIRSQEIVPVPMSHFAAIVDGFFNVEFRSVGDRSWKIHKRGELQTIRLDRAVLSTVDFARSVGIVGQRHLQGSLYVYLDASHQEPIIVLRNNDQYWKEPVADRLYLIESRWRVWNIRRSSATEIAFTTQGFGIGQMRWCVPVDGHYVVRVEGEEPFEAQAHDGILSLTLKKSLQPLQVVIARGRISLWHAKWNTQEITSWLRSGRGAGQSIWTLGLHVNPELQ